MSLIQLKFTFCVWCEAGIWFHFFFLQGKKECSHSVVCNAVSIIYQVSTGGGVYFWPFCVVPEANSSISPPIPPFEKSCMVCYVECRDSNYLKRTFSLIGPAVAIHVVYSEDHVRCHEGQKSDRGMSPANENSSLPTTGSFAALWTQGLGRRTCSTNLRWLNDRSSKDGEAWPLPSMGVPAVQRRERYRRSRAKQKTNRSEENKAVRTKTL